MAEVAQEVPEAADPLFDLLNHRSVECIAAAAHALGAMRLQPERMIPELTLHLADNDDRVVTRATAMALAAYGGFTERMFPAILNRFKLALVEIDSLTTLAVAELFVAKGPEVRDYLRQHWSDDRELRRRALAAIDEARARRRGRGPVESNTGNDIAYGQLGLLPIFFPKHVDSPGGRYGGGLGPPEE